MSKRDESIVNAVENSVIAFPYPAVYISGGIDSTVVLHHLCQKVPCNEIRTYTAKFDSPKDTHLVAEEIARYYGVKHTTIDMTQFDYVSDLPHILRLFRNPQWNVWIWYLARQAFMDGVKNVYLGEWGDELFGYPDRSCLQAYADQISRITPMYHAVHADFWIKVHMPFSSLEPCLKSKVGYEPKAFQEWFSPNKGALREAYANVLPSRVMELVTPCCAPAFTDYVNIGRIYLKKHFPNVKLDTADEVKEVLWRVCVNALFTRMHETPFSSRR